MSYIGCNDCGGDRMPQIDAEGNIIEGNWANDIRYMYPLEDLVWVKIENYTDHSQGVPSITGKNNGSYGNGANGDKLIVHKHDQAVWSEIFVLIPDREVVGIGKEKAEIEVEQVDPDEAMRAAEAIASGEADDLTTIDGIGSVGASKLVAAEVKTFEALAMIEVDRLLEILGAPANAEKAAEMIEESLQLAAAKTSGSDTEK